jgi:hypothetical protein
VSPEVPLLFPLDDRAYFPKGLLVLLLLRYSKPVIQMFPSESFAMLLEE